MMKTKFLRIVALLLVCVALLCSCGKQPTKLRLENDVYRAKKLKQVEIAYREAPYTYRATSILEGTVVCLATGGIPDEFPLYAIENADPDNWLTDEYYSLFYNADITLPTLAEMKPYSISLCDVVGDYARERGTLNRDYQAEIDELVKELTEGKSYPKELLSLHDHTLFELLFHSEQYPEFYYVLEYWKYTEPVVFMDGDQEITVETGVIYDRANGCFYTLGDMLEEYFIKANPET